MTKNTCAHAECRLYTLSVNSKPPVQRILYFNGWHQYQCNSSVNNKACTGIATEFLNAFPLCNVFVTRTFAFHLISKHRGFVPNIPDFSYNSVHYALC